MSSISFFYSFYGLIEIRTASSANVTIYKGKLKTFCKEMVSENVRFRAIVESHYLFDFIAVL